MPDVHLLSPGRRSGFHGPGIAGAVIDQVEVGIVGDPAPDVAAADLPGIRRPGRDAEVLALVAFVERLEVWADQHVLVGTGAVGRPRRRAVRRVERLDPAAHADLAAGVADEHLALHHERRHRHGLADVDVADLGLPDRFARCGIDGDRMAVQRVEEDAAVRESGAAIDHVAAGDALRGRLGLRLVLPLHRRARLGQVERVEDVGIGSDDIHRVADDERRRLLPLVHAGREGEGDLKLADIRPR